jgi:predicted RNase H-like HicB family nuclease
MSSAPVLSSYLDAAMRRAHYELIDGGETVYAEIPGMDGVYATSATVEACRTELREVLEEWVLLGLAMRHAIPPVDGIELAVREAI